MGYGAVTSSTASSPSSSGAGPSGYDSVLAVVAHPDDESFGLGAVLCELVERSASVSVLCFTHGEASTLATTPGDLGRIRSGELAAAAGELGITAVELREHHDGGLPAVPIAALVQEVAATAGRARADLLVAFDEGGVTGHPDHVRATEAAVAAGRALGLPVLGWAVHRFVAERLNAEFATSFLGRGDDEIDFVLEVDRTRQLRAIRRHESQSTENPVLWRRLELAGGLEPLRWLRPEGR